MEPKLTPEELAQHQAWDKAVSGAFDIWKDRIINATLVAQDIIQHLRDLDDDEQLGGNFNPSDDALLAAAVAILPMISANDWDIDYVF